MTEPVKKTHRKWSPDDIARMISMREREGRTWGQIDAALKRPPGGSLQKYMMWRDGPAPSHGPSQAGERVEVSQRQEIERRNRQAAENHMSLTAMIFGDPPPGFSALDRRRP